MFYCQLTGILQSGKAYGVGLGGTAQASEGYYAPVKLQTRVSGLDSDAGPIIDTNDVFDSIFVIKKALSATLQVSIAPQDI